MTSSSALPPSLALTIDPPIAELVLSRPEKRNALNDRTVLGLAEAVATLPETIGALVLSGAGDHFCAGLDLSEVGGEPDLLGGLHHSRMWHRAFEAMEFGRLPVIAVLKGAVVGGGFELAAATHIRIAEKSTFFALPEGQRGIFLGGGGAVRIPRLIGVPLVQDMMLTGRVLSAEEAHRAGACQYLVEDGEGMALARKLAAKAAANAPMTNFAIINVLPRTAEGATATGYLAEALAATLAQNMPEAKARVRDFLAKKAAKVERPS